MKKLLFILAAITIFATSCSKEAKLNRSLDGTWKVVSMGGESMDGMSMSVTFEKEKAGKGTYSTKMTFEALNISETSTGTYELVDDVTLIMTDDEAGSETDSTTVVSYSKKELVLRPVGDVTGDMVLEKE